MRRLLKKIMPSPGALQQQWFLRPFGPRIADPRLWVVHRRTVTTAFGAGLAICFIPLPVHMIVAGCLAVFLRLNVPAIYGTIFLVNPLTAVPVYYTAYWVGTLVTGAEPQAVDWHSLESFDTLASLGSLWKPFVAGCLVCGVIAGCFGWIGAELLWRWNVLSRRYRRHHVRPA